MTLLSLDSIVLFLLAMRSVNLLSNEYMMMTMNMFSFRSVITIYLKHRTDTEAVLTWRWWCL